MAADPCAYTVIPLVERGRVKTWIRAAAASPSNLASVGQRGGDEMPGQGLRWAFQGDVSAQGPTTLEAVAPS
jgi:hypothetical protein